MKEFLIYTLQVNAALFLFYALYKYISVRDTHLKARRFFLLALIAVAFSYPAVSLSGWLVEQAPGLRINYEDLFAPYAQNAEMEKAVVTINESSRFSVEKLITILWSSVSLLLTLRIVMQLLSILHLASKGTPVNFYGMKLIALPPEISPFSFFGWIFVNPAYYDEQELQDIIAHEKAHISQRHSLDILAGELLCILFWYNPAAWLIRHEIRQNLEFLADNEVIRSGNDRKSYQYHLLRLSHQSAAAQIVNNFNVSQLKKRIMMMNKKKASRFGLLRYALLIPVTGILILTGNSTALAQAEIGTSQTIAREVDGNMEIQTVEGGKVVGKSTVMVTQGHTLNEKGDTIYTTVGKKAGKKEKITFVLGQEAKDSVIVYSYMAKSGKHKYVGSVQNGKIQTDSIRSNSRDTTVSVIISL